MNLYFRLLYMLLTVKFKGRVSVFDTFTSKHIVWPNDIDPLGHMNNGRYLTVTDSVRIEMLIRAGVFQAMKSRGQYAIVAGETIQFRESLKPFQRYEILTRTLGWDKKFFYVEHQFRSGSTLHALAMVKICVIGKGRPWPADVLRYVYSDVEDVNMNQVIENWNVSSDEHWGRADLDRDQPVAEVKPISLVR